MKYDKNKGCVRVTFDAEIPIEHHERMKMVMFACGAGSLSDLMNHGFSILEWAMLETLRGHQVGGFSPDSGEITLLDSPALRNVESRRIEVLGASLKANGD